MAVLSYASPVGGCLSFLARQIVGSFMEWYVEAMLGGSSGTHFLAADGLGAIADAVPNGSDIRTNDLKRPLEFALGLSGRFRQITPQHRGSRPMTVNEMLQRDMEVADECRLWADPCETPAPDTAMQGMTASSPNCKLKRLL